MLMLVAVAGVDARQYCTSLADCQYSGCIYGSWYGCSGIEIYWGGNGLGSWNPTSYGTCAVTYDSGTDWYYCSDKPCPASCPTGQYIVNCWCKPCPAGSFCTGSAAISGTCAVGKYSGTGQGSCTSCGAGTYGTGTGLSACTACGAGTYSTAVGATDASTCRDCDWGLYSFAGATACTSCTAMW